MKKRKILATLFMSTMMFMTGCQGNVTSSNQSSSTTSTQSSVVDPVGINITSDGDVTSLEVGKTLKLNAVVLPEGADQNVVWSTSSEEIATVNEEGVVTAVKVGNVLITATSTKKSEIKKEFALQITPKAVVEVTPESISITTNDNVTSLKAGATLQLNAKVLPEGASQEVQWSSSDIAKATVSASGVVKGILEGEVTITATSKKLDTVKQEIKLTIEKADDVTTTVDWENTAVTTHDEFVNAEKNAPIKAKGKVVYVTPLSNDGTVNYYMQNGTEGYYIYKQNLSNFNVEVGKSYEVGGFYKYHNGTSEIVDVEYLKEVQENIDVTIVDISNMAVLNNTEMKPHQDAYIEIKNATIKSKPSDYTKAYSVTVTTGDNDIAMRINPTEMTGDEFDAITSKLSASPVGTTVSFKGFLTAFGYGKATNQIQVVRSEDLSLQEASSQDLVNAAIENLYLQNSIEKDVNSITLPTKIEGFDDVSVTWSSSNEIVITNSGSVTHQANDVEVTLTATVSHGTSSAQKSFVVNVFGNNVSFNLNHLLSLEDAAEANSYGVSATKPSYDDKGNNQVKLGFDGQGNIDQRTWQLRNALIAGSDSDRKNGNFSIRMQQNAVQESSGRIELCEDLSFDYLEFKAGIYGNNSLGVVLKIYYSTDSGSTWTYTNKSYTINTRSLETIRLAIPVSTTGRVAIEFVSGTGTRVNIDDISLLKAI